MSVKYDVDMKVYSSMMVHRRRKYICVIFKKQ